MLVGRHTYVLVLISCRWTCRQFRLFCYLYVNDVSLRARVNLADHLRFSMSGQCVGRRR